MLHGGNVRQYIHDGNKLRQERDEARAQVTSLKWALQLVYYDFGRCHEQKEKSKCEDYDACGEVANLIRMALSETPASMLDKINGPVKALEDIYAEFVAGGRPEFVAMRIKNIAKQALAKWKGEA
jgi:hypothetical protein